MDISFVDQNILSQHGKSIHKKQDDIPNIGIINPLVDLSGSSGSVQAYIEQQQQQQPSSAPAQGNVTAAEEANAPETEVAPDAVERQDPHSSEAPTESEEAEAAAQVPTTVSAEQPAQHDEPVEPELSAQDAGRSTSRGTEEKQDQEGEPASREPYIEEGASGNRRGDSIGQKANMTVHREVRMRLCNPAYRKGCELRPPRPIVAASSAGVS